MADPKRRAKGPAKGAPSAAQRAAADAAPEEAAQAAPKGDATPAANPPALPKPTPAPLLYLDVDDEITSAAARIRSAEAQELAVVLPYGSRLATSRINFRLLAREAGARGKQIQIISADASARALASAAGLPVHASVAAFEAARAGGPEGPTDGAVGAAGDEPGAGGAAATGAAGPGRAATAGGAAAAAGAGVAGTGIAGPGVARAPVGGLSIEDDTQTRVLTLPRARPERLPIVGPPRPPVRTGLAVGLGLAAIVVVIAGGLLALELLPSATIVLAPRSEAIGPIELTVEARLDAAAPDPATLVIPSQRFTFALEATQAITATGVKVTETKSTGNVTFSNFDTGRGVLIPAGTIVRTDDDIEFVTLAELTLPRAQIDFFPPFPTRPSTGSVGVEAVEPGEGSNVGNNTITDVARGGRNLLVTNPEPTTGGSRTEAPEISEDDVAAAVEAIEAALAADLDDQVAGRVGVPEAVELFDQTKVMGEVAFTPDPTELVGSTELEVELAGSAEGSMLGVDPGPIQQVAEARLQSRVNAGWSLAPGSVVVQPGEPSLFGDVTSYPVSVAATQVHDVDAAALIEQIRGRVVAEARARLDDFGDVEISVWPDWVTTMPRNADRITLNLAAPRPAASASPSP